MIGNLSTAILIALNNEEHINRFDLIDKLLLIYPVFEVKRAATVDTRLVVLNELGFVESTIGLPGYRKYNQKHWRTTKQGRKYLDE